MKRCLIRLNHESVLRMLSEANLDGKKDVRIIINLYWLQEAEVKITEYTVFDKFKIMKGVSKGVCCHRCSPIQCIFIGNLQGSTGK